MKKQLLFIFSFIILGSYAQDRDVFLKNKNKHYYQSKNYYLVNQNNEPLDSAFLIVAGVYTQEKYAHNDNKRIMLMFPDSKVVFNKGNNRYYIIIQESKDVDKTIDTLKSLRSMYEPLAWVLVYY
jgi:Ni,Fe-hydrogenase III small subunit